MAAAAQIDIFIGSDDSFAPLADAEPIMYPRFVINERAAGSGVDFFFEPWRASLVASLPAGMVGAIPAVDLAKQIGSRFQSHLPDEMLATLLPSMDARMAHVAAFQGPPVLDASNVHVALPHCDVLLATITIDTPGTEMMRMLGTIVQAELGNVPTVLSNVSLVESRLNYLAARMLRG